MAKKTTTRPKATEPTVGEQIIAGLTELRDALREGVHLEERFTVRKVRISLEPPPYTPDDIKAVRDRLGTSQAVFAKLIGVSPSTVQAWERGENVPGIARRVLQMIQRDPTPWREMLTVAVKR